MPYPLLSYLWVSLAALAAGAINSIAGGGTLITFPSLLNVVSAVVANGTNTTALVPGSLAGAWAFRREIRHSRAWLLLLVGPSFIGAIVGALLVTRGNDATFKMLIPWLILFAAILLMIQPVLSRHVRLGHGAVAPPVHRALPIIALQFCIAVYGGYFGAGIGILMLSGLGFLGIGHIHQMNALKNVLASIINGTAAVVFIIEDKVDPSCAATMAVTAIIGGYLGASLSRRVKPIFVRWLVILIGFGLSAYYFAK